MHQFLKLAFVAAAALSLTGCLWGPGKFTSELTLKKGGAFVLDYRGEMVLQLPPDSDSKPDMGPWTDDTAQCFVGEDGTKPTPTRAADDRPKYRPCTKAEIASQRADYEKQRTELASSKRKQTEDMAKMFGLPGLDDASNRAFAAKLMKYAGWRSVTYRGKGVFDVDYHFEGRATQDFLFPALPDNDMIIPFIAIRRRADGTVMVTAPAFTGGSGPLAARAGQSTAAGMKDGPSSRAEGRFTIVTDGEILTNNSEDGATAHATGRQLRWDVTSTSNKIPETLIRL
ncbi:MAG TPA: hypothetical protein VJV39_03260 [Dongiaceae bacterium]|nr:hypothetical protein [Dongiaceae bacterium]